MLTFLDQTDSDTDGDQSMPPKLSEHSPKEFLLNLAARLKTENESNRAKEQAQSIYLMFRRHRGSMPADNFGFWRDGVWCESPMFGKLHGTNVFQELIRGAEGNFNQADIQLDVTANRNNQETRAVVRIARRINEILKERQWTETARQSAFYANILGLNGFYISRFDKSKGAPLPVPQFGAVKYETGGRYVCPQCYHAGDFSSVQDNYQCPECGSETLSVLDQPQQTKDYLVNGFGSRAGGETEMVVADGLDVSCDPNGKPADIKSCRWIEWRHLAQKSELKRLYPHLKLANNSDWSYQTKLKMGLQRYESGESSPSSDLDKNTYEMRQIWLDLTEYEDYIPPVDFKIGAFAFKTGEPLKNTCPDGLVMGVVSGELAFVDAESKNERVSASNWLSDGVSFVGLGAKAGLLIQKKINHLDNMVMEGESRSLKGAVIYDPEAVDGSNLEGANTNIPLRPDYANDKGIGHAVLPLSVEGLSQASLLYLGSQKQTMQEIMGVPDVTLGQNTANDPTLGGQALRSRNALGLLIPAAQSLARAMELWLKHQLQLIQDNYAPEALYRFGTAYGEDWQQDEIEAFYAANFDQDITIAYTPGSEIPESRFDKQARLRADVVAQFIPLTPEVRAQIASESNYGIDVGNYESNEKLADKRFDFLNENIREKPAAENAYLQAEQTMLDPQTGARQTDEAGNPAVNPVVSQITSAPQMRIYADVEDHPQMVEYWGRKVRALAASGTPQSDLLIAVCNAMVTKHNLAIFQKTTQQRSLDALASAPAQVGGQMLNATPPEPQPIDPNAMQSKNLEMANNIADRNHQAGMQARQHQHEQAMAKMQGAK